MRSPKLFSFTTSSIVSISSRAEDLAAAPEQQIETAWQSDEAAYAEVRASCAVAVGTLLIDDFHPKLFLNSKLVLSRNRLVPAAITIKRSTIAQAQPAAQHAPFNRIQPEIFIGHNPRHCPSLCAMLRLSS
jgi:hypothetical protein